MAIDIRRVTLISGSGGATATSTIAASVVGRLVKIIVHNDATDQPDDNWDLTIYHGTASSPDYEAVFTDATVSQTKTAAVVYNPVTPATKAADGSASSLTEVPPILYGPLTITGANMGNSKVAVVELVIEVA